MARTVVLEATDPPAVDWSAARIWRVIVTVNGRPCAAFWTPSPGRLRDPGRFTRALLDPGRVVSDYEHEYERFRRRMGMAPRPTWRRPTCTLVVCTHRRSAYLPGLLDAVSRLQPPPDEFIVVDNDPGEQDSRALIEAAGATYVREDRRGLDHARTAGLRQATRRARRVHGRRLRACRAVAGRPRRAVRRTGCRRRHRPGFRVGAGVPRPAALRARGRVQPRPAAPRTSIGRCSRRSTPARSGPART